MKHCIRKQDKYRSTFAPELNCDVFVAVPSSKSLCHGTLFRNMQVRTCSYYRHCAKTPGAINTIITVAHAHQKMKWFSQTFALLRTVWPKLIVDQVLAFLAITDRVVCFALHHRLLWKVASFAPLHSALCDVVYVPWHLSLGNRCGVDCRYTYDFITILCAPVDMPVISFSYTPMFSFYPAEAATLHTTLAYQSLYVDFFGDGCHVSVSSNYQPFIVGVLGTIDETVPLFNSLCATFTTGGAVAKRLVYSFDEICLASTGNTIWFFLALPGFPTRDVDPYRALRGAGNLVPLRQSVDVDLKLESSSNQSWRMHLYGAE